MHNLKDAQMNLQCNLIQDIMFYEFDLGYRVLEAIKIISYTKGEYAVDHSWVTRVFKRFHFGCTNFDD